MKLSEAIKKGSQKNKQAFGFLTRRIIDESNELVITTCALGAAYVGAFNQLPYGVDGKNPYHRLRELFPELQTIYSNLDETYVAVRGCSLESQIVHLNDTQHLSREKIAELLEKKGY